MKRLEPQQMLGLRVMGKKGLDAYCRKNTFAHLSKGNDEKNPYGVYFVGTNSIQYCKKLKIGINQFIDSLEKQILYIRKIYVDQPIYFIPHGRDSNETVKLMCEKWQFMPILQQHCST